MYSTQVFYFIQRQIVVLLTGDSPRSYMPFYAKPITIHKGVDNQIQFQFLNQAQKTVDITGKEIICRLISYDGTRVLLKKSLTLQYPVTGIAALVVTPTEIENIDAQKCYYSLEIPVGTFNYPVYLDQLCGARGDVNIVNSVLPNFVPSDNVTIPTDQIFPNTDPTLCNTLAGTTLTYFTSVISTDDNPIITLQASYTEYSGNVTIEGSTLPTSGWYIIGNVHQYSNYTDTEGYVIEGQHPYIRMKFSSSYGQVDNVLAR